MTQDPPDEQDAAASTPDPKHAAPAVPGPFADDVPEAPPQVEMIDDSDLGWLDAPEISEAERARRRERWERHKAKVRRKRRIRKTLKYSGITFGVFLVLFAIWFQLTLGGLSRMPASAGQAGLNTPGTTMLLVGSNPAEPDATGTSWQSALHRSDLVMLVHLTRDNRAMFVISLPGRTQLPIPGRGPGRLGEAYDAGGEKLYVKTIESFSGIRLDHVAVMDLNGLREITDQLDGMIVNVPRVACDLPVGPRRLDGQQALDFMALDPCLPRGDLDRVERQQTVFKSLMRAAVDSGKVANPFTATKMLRSTASHLTLEDGYSYPAMLGTLFSMRKLRTTNTTFLTVPTKEATGTIDPDATIEPDDAKDAALWDALRRDRLDEYLATNEDAVVLR